MLSRRRCAAAHDAADGGLDDRPGGHRGAYEVAGPRRRLLGPLPRGGVPHGARLRRRGERERLVEVLADARDGRELRGLRPVGAPGGVERPNQPEQIADGFKRERIVPAAEHVPTLPEAARRLRAMFNKICEKIVNKQLNRGRSMWRKSIDRGGSIGRPGVGRGRSRARGSARGRLARPENTINVNRP